MKKLLYIGFLLPFILGCTLSMEDYVLTEEELGFEEPRTIKSEYGTVTYQFNEGVIYVSDNVQEYLAQVDHDSILYFMTTIPDKWRPEVGAKLAAGCSHKLPFGLNHRVISVEDVGGFLKVVCTKTTQEDVYKQLDYNLDASVSCPDLSGISDDSLLLMGYERRDSIIINWNPYDSIMGINRYAPTTRADEDNYEKDELKEPDVLIDWYFDTRNLSGLKDGASASLKCMKQCFNDVLTSLNEKEALPTNGKINFKPSFYAGLSLKITNHIKVHAEKNKAREYECNYTETWYDAVVKAEVGIDATATKDRAFLGESVNQIDAQTTKWTVLKTAYGSKVVKSDLVSKANQKQHWTNAEVRVPLGAIGPVSFAFLAGANLNPILSFGGCLSVSGTLTSAHHRTGYETGPDGNKRDIDEDVKGLEATKKFSNVSLDGHAKAGASFRAYAGIEVCCAVACTVGANVEAMLDLEGTVDVLPNPFKSDLDFQKPTGSAQFYVKFFGDVQIHVQPLGIHLWEKQIYRFWEKYLVNINTKLEPNLFAGLISSTNEGHYDCTGYWKIESSGLLWLNLASIGYKPGMILYLGPMKDGEGILMEEYEGWGDAAKPPFESVNNKTYYYFQLQGEYPSNVTEFYAQPCIYKKDDNGDLIVKTIDGADCPKNEVGGGKVVLKDTWQIMGEEYWIYSNTAADGYIDPKTGLHSGHDEEVGENGETTDGYYFQGSYDVNKMDLRQYKMMAQFDVQNGSRIRYWGVRVQLYGPDKKTKLLGTGRGKAVRVHKTKSGKYTLIFKFLSTWKKAETSTANEECLYYTLTPYWHDSETNEAIYGDTSPKLKIEYEYPDLLSDYSDLSSLGTVIPEVDLDH